MGYVVHLFLLVLIMFGCGKKEESKNEAKPFKRILIPNKVKKQADTIEFISYLILNKSDNENFSIQISKREAIITFGKNNEIIIGQYDKKIKYFNRLGDVIAIVRNKPNEILITNTDEQLIWKIKIEDKLKIADNEAMRNAFEIHSGINQTCKVFAFDKALGNLQVKGRQILLKGSKNFETEFIKNYPALGILLVQPIPEDMRLVILTELLRFSN